MAAQHNAPVEVDPKELERARKDWADYTKLMKYGIIATAVILVLMLAFLY